MLKLKFFLKKATGANQSAIFLICHWQGNVLKYSPGISVNVNFWNKKEGFYKCTQENPNYKNQNSALTTIQRKIEEAFYNYYGQKGHYPNKIALKEAIENAFEKDSSNSKASNFMDYTQYLVIQRKNKDAIIGKSTNKNCITSSYKQTSNLLLEFKAAKVSFEAITHGFYDDFIEYCLYRKNYKPNNIGKHIRNIKSIMNKALEDGRHSNVAFKKFYKPNQEVEAIYLTPDEISQICALEFNKNESHLEASRDLFIIACWTGLRYGDWQQYSRLSRLEDLVSIKTTKTGTEVVIPKHPMVKKICNKYDQSLPRPKANQPINRDLKRIGELAGISDKIELNTVKGGQVIKNVISKYELITSHTARRSFATNTYNMGISSFDIMQITGHKTEKSFLRYIKITKNESAKRIQALFDKVI